MAINTDSAWTRVYVDIPTSVASRLDEKAKEKNVTKKKFISDAIISACGGESSSKKGNKQ